MRIRVCEICGYEPDDGHNPETHAMEMRAHYYEMFEPHDRDDYDDRDYDGVVAAECGKCGESVDEDSLRDTGSRDVPYDPSTWYCEKCYDAWLQEPVGAGR